MATAATTCNGCKKRIVSLDFLECMICKNLYDLNCINITQKIFENSTREFKDNWTCPECLSARPKTGNIHTPVRKSLVGWNSTFVTDHDSTLEDSTVNINMAPRGGDKDSKLLIDNSITGILEGIRSELSILKLQNAEILPLKQEVKHLTEIIGNMSKEISSLRQELFSRDMNKVDHKEGNSRSDISPVTNKSYAAKLSNSLQKPNLSLPHTHQHIATSSSSVTVCDESHTGLTLLSQKHSGQRADNLSTIVARKSEPNGKQPIVQENEWKTVINKKKKTFTEIKKGGNINISQLKGLERKKHLHVWRLRKSTTETDLLNHINSLKICTEEIKVEKIKMKVEKDYGSFIISIPESKYDLFCDPNIWPIHAEFSEWIWFPRNRSKETTPT